MTLRHHLPTESFQAWQTPFYYYDMELLRTTLREIQRACSNTENLHVHYAVKANANPKLLAAIAAAGLGADCVSGGEIRAAIDAGFPAGKIVFAGVGKSDWEIRTALEHDIFCFNVESLPELDNISHLAAEMGRKARVALRINPNVDAHTHKKITTGMAENKFGIAMEDMIPAIRHAAELPCVDCIGLHFHIGSQILDLDCFPALAERINELQDTLDAADIRLTHINVGGGLGIDYEAPLENPVPSFAEYFDSFLRYLKLRPGQQLHFEPGRSVVGQCGHLISRVLYVKQGATKQFLILDAGFTDLIRPAMYGARHAITNLTASAGEGETDTDRRVTYDVVGPICESSDVFATDIPLPQSQRGDLIALHSAGAYGEVMASTYNCRALPQVHTSDELS